MRRSMSLKPKALDSVSLPVASSKWAKKWLSAGASFKGVINTHRSNPFSWDPKYALEVVNNYKTSTKGTIIL